MKNIQNKESVQRQLGRWEPGDLAYVEAFEYKCSSNGEKSRLRIVALFQRRDRANKWPSEDRPTVRATIEFEGVSNFQMKAVGPYPKQITGFDIRDVSDSGWEGVNFVVEDYENGQLSFNCEEIRVIDSGPTNINPLA